MTSLQQNIFIIGVGRSGTSLLQSMLNAHSEITFLPETQFFRQYIADEKKANILQKEGISAFIEILKKDTRFRRLPINLLSLYNISSSHLSLGVYNAIFQQYRFRNKCNIIGDKDPKNIEHLDALHKYFPNAKVIHIYRDPRDIVLSKTKADWSSNRPYWLHALIGQIQLSNGRTLGLQLFKDNFIEIKYEDLIHQPAQELQIICKRLNIEFEHAMLQFSEAAKELVSPSEMQWKKETLGPLLKNNTQKWKISFNKNQIKTIEVCSPYSFKKLTYQYAKKNYLMHQFIWTPLRFLFQIFYRLFKV